MFSDSSQQIISAAGSATESAWTMSVLSSSIDWRVSFMKDASSFTINCCVPLTYPASYPCHPTSDPNNCSCPWSCPCSCTFPPSTCPCLVLDDDRETEVIIIDTLLCPEWGDRLVGDRICWKIFACHFILRATSKVLAQMEKIQLTTSYILQNCLHPLPQYL